MPSNIDVHQVEHGIYSSAIARAEMADAARPASRVPGARAASVGGHRVLSAVPLHRQPTCRTGIGVSAPLHPAAH